MISIYQPRGPPQTLAPRQVLMCPTCHMWWTTPWVYRFLDSLHQVSGWLMFNHSCFLSDELLEGMHPLNISKLFKLSCSTICHPRMLLELFGPLAGLPSGILWVIDTQVASRVARVIFSWVFGLDLPGIVHSKTVSAWQLLSIIQHRYGSPMVSLQQLSTNYWRQIQTISNQWLTIEYVVNLSICNWICWIFFSDK